MGIDTTELSHLYPSEYPDRLASAYIKARVELNSKGKVTGTVVDMVKVLTVLERWMWSKFGEKRPVETIPPEELDLYLAEFYRVLRKQSGRDYQPPGMNKYRFCIGRFLKENGYPCCSSTSEKFHSSQMAFKLRIQELGGYSKKSA